MKNTVTLPFRGERLMAMPPGNTSNFLFWFVLVLSCLKVFPQNFHFVWYWILNLGPVCSLALRLQTLWRSFLLEVNKQIQPVQTSSFRLNGKAGTLSLLFFRGSSVTFNDFSLWLLTTQGHPWFFKCWAALLWLHMSTNCIFSLCICLIQNWQSTVQPLRSFSQVLSGHEDSTTMVLTHPFCYVSSISSWVTCIRFG